MGAVPTGGLAACALPGTTGAPPLPLFLSLNWTKIFLLSIPWVCSKISEKLQLKVSKIASRVTSLKDFGICVHQFCARLGTDAVPRHFPHESGKVHGAKNPVRGRQVPP